MEIALIQAEKTVLIIMEIYLVGIKEIIMAAVALSKIMYIYTLIESIVYHFSFYLGYLCLEKSLKSLPTFNYSK